MSQKKNTKILLFGDKRHRETRPRQSVFSIDDTDFLMEVRAARRQSIEKMTNDDTVIAHRNIMNLNRVFGDFAMSSDNVRNIFPMNREVQEKVSQNQIPDLTETRNGKASDSLTEESSSHKETSSSSLTEKTDNAETTETTQPAWYRRLGAMARRQQQQEKAYHDTLDEHHKAKAEKALKQQQNYPYWQRRKSSRDGMDLSRDVALALRHNSIYAMADSITRLPDFDGFDDDADDDANYRTGYIQGTQLAVDPKTKKFVLDLIA